MKPIIPAYEIRQRKLQGSPHTAHTIIVRGQVIRSQLAPFGPGEADAIVRAFIGPPPTSRLDDVPAFLESDKKALARAARGGKGKKYDFGRDGKVDE